MVNFINSKVNGEVLKNTFLDTEAWMSTIITSIQHCTEGHNQCNKVRVRIQKEIVKLSLLVEDIILYI